MTSTDPITTLVGDCLTTAVALAQLATARAELSRARLFAAQIREALELDAKATDDDVLKVAGAILQDLRHAQRMERILTRENDELQAQRAQLQDFVDELADVYGVDLEKPGVASALIARIHDSQMPEAAE